MPELDCLDGIGVVIKRPGADSGLADLPWHQDCGLGGHPVLCPSIARGHPARPRVGRDRPAPLPRRLAPGLVAPAPHRPSSTRLPTVAIDTDPGDVTAALRARAPRRAPPTGRGQGRRAMYVTATAPDTLAFIGSGTATTTCCSPATARSTTSTRSSAR